MRPYAKYLLVAIVAALAIGWRMFNGQTMLLPNLELFTALSFVAASLLRPVFAVAVPILTLAASDLLLGNTSIFLWTWTAWLLVIAAAFLFRKDRGSRTPLYGGIYGATGATIFFIVSNFGVWVQGLSMGYSTPGIGGLMTTYALGIPFYLIQLGGNVVLVPLAALAVQAVRHRYPTSILATERAHRGRA
jgi:signal transduction histidine kinase